MANRQPPLTPFTLVADSSSSASPATEIPAVIAGPILRRTEPGRVVIWLAARAAAAVRLTLTPEGQPSCTHHLQQDAPGLTCLQAGTQLCYLLIDLPLEQPLPTGCWIDYQLALQMVDDPAGGWCDHREWGAELLLPGRRNPGFRLGERVSGVLHGSCRKPHHPGGDGLVEAERLLAKRLAAAESGDTAAPWPDLLVLSGDQIYADDVAGPLLRAIHQLMARLGIANECFASCAAPALHNSAQLAAHRHSYYRRLQLLPHNGGDSLRELIFAGARKPVFTSDNANNHLISLGEFLAMYLLVWSPEPWRLIEWDVPSGLNRDELRLYREEQNAVAEFVEQLPAVRRVLAQLPTAMIFDDHDISDDWNLSREWEETAYQNPLSRRMVGNGLLAYLINQGWGNDPDQFDPSLLNQLGRALQHSGDAGHQRLIDQLLGLQCWDYQWNTQPPLVVLDSRTRRWRSESSARKPSGLLDWEALIDLQQCLHGKQAVILVVPAPIFGVKLIEVIQRLFTLAGYPLVVDAENWMAHPGTANGILNVFRHRNTPQHFVVLSGDVHYSFVYDVELRGRRRGPDIWQICSSGLRNGFPEPLLGWLDRANRLLYGPRSLLNWFTKRRRMRVIPRKPSGTAPGRRLLNASGVGWLELDAEGCPQRIQQLLTDGQRVDFERREQESRWD